MGTGKELARMMSCGIWNEWVKNKPYYCWSQIFDHDGKPISLEKAKTKTFCHVRILLAGDIADQYVALLGDLLRLVASTSGESMNLAINTDYGFYEIVIS